MGQPSSKNESMSTSSEHCQLNAAHASAISRAALVYRRLLAARAPALVFSILFLTGDAGVSATRSLAMLQFPLLHDFAAYLCSDTLADTLQAAGYSSYQGLAERQTAGREACIPNAEQREQNSSWLSVGQMSVQFIQFPLPRDPQLDTSPKPRPSSTNLPRATIPTRTAVILVSSAD